MGTLGLPHPNQLTPGTHQGPPGQSYIVTNDGTVIVTYSLNPPFVLHYYWSSKTNGWVQG
jgi:hypothetical protein